MTGGLVPLWCLWLLWSRLFRVKTTSRACLYSLLHPCCWGLGALPVNKGFKGYCIPPTPPESTFNFNYMAFSFPFCLYMAWAFIRLFVYYLFLRSILSPGKMIAQQESIIVLIFRSAAILQLWWTARHESERFYYTSLGRATQGYYPRWLIWPGHYGHRQAWQNCISFPTEFIKSLYT